MKNLPLNQLHESLSEEFNITLKALGYNRGKDNPLATLIREFLFFLERSQVEDVRKCTRKEIEAFFIYISERQNQKRLEEKLGWSHIRHLMRSIERFFDFLLKTNEIEALPAPISKYYRNKNSEREILSEEEVLKLYDNCKTPEDKVIITLAYGCGLRRTEMVSLKIRDIILNQNILIVRDGKNHKNRTIPISDSIKKDFQEYLKKRLRKPKTNTRFDLQFFYSITAGGTGTYGEILNKKLKKLIRLTFPDSPRMRKISLHSLRASIAVHLINRGAEITLIQRFLGHSCIDSTHVYAKRRKQRSAIQNMVWRTSNTDN